MVVRYEDRSASQSLNLCVTKKNKIKNRCQFPSILRQPLIGTSNRAISSNQQYLYGWDVVPVSRGGDIWQRGAQKGSKDKKQGNEKEQVKRSSNYRYVLARTCTYSSYF